MKDLGVFIDAKLHFHNHVNYILPHCIKLLGIVHSITLAFSSLESMLRLYIILVRSKLEYASVVWKLITSTDTKKPERIQQWFAVLCFNHTFPGVHYCYSLTLKELRGHTLPMRRHCLDALFLTQVYFGFKFCPSLLEIIGLRVPTRYIRDFALFSVSSSSKNCSSAKCASAANVVRRDVDVLHINNFLYYAIIIIIITIIIMTSLFVCLFVFCLRFCINCIFSSACL
jgi:hypothetical protein